MQSILIGILTTCLSRAIKIDLSVNEPLYVPLLQYISPLSSKAAALLWLTRNRSWLRKSGRLILRMTAAIFITLSANFLLLPRCENE